MGVRMEQGMRADEGRREGWGGGGWGWGNLQTVKFRLKLNSNVLGA